MASNPLRRAFCRALAKLLV
uniref:Uncharacterized protein n=1 Tax=Arundo donax TaxID=35708 RepID=A0A0A9BVG3_ARUDO